VVLPDVDSYEPTDNGESPLAKMTDWVNTTCPHCGAPAKRETDTMPQWAGSSWYFLRYMDAHNDEALASDEALKYWGQVDWYNGGMEHTTLHLLYSRFWHKFLYDIGVVPFAEPYAKRTSHGMILGEGGIKMSKSRGNVVNPDEIVENYGADTMRLYEMFLGDFEKAAPWNPNDIKGCRRFLERVWALSEKLEEGTAYSKANEVAMHRLIKKVDSDAENLKANTAIAAMMTVLNQFEKNGCNKAEFKTFITVLNPFAPHITEELNEMIFGDEMLAKTAWPTYEEAKTVESSVEIAVQVNGKVRGVVTVAADAEEEQILETAMADAKVQNALAGMEIVKRIVIKKKIVNFVVKPQK
jgi:leucyl-tRNA synthetase